MSSDETPESRVEAGADEASQQNTDTSADTSADVQELAEDVSITA